MRAFESAIALNPDKAWMHYNLGNAYEGLEKYKKAIAAYQTTLRLDPEGEYGQYARTEIELLRQRQGP